MGFGGPSLATTIDREYGGGVGAKWLDALHHLHVLIYLHSWIMEYKTGNISETVEDRAKVTINGLYKVVHWLSIAAKMYDLE